MKRKGISARAWFYGTSFHHSAFVAAESPVEPDADGRSSEATGGNECERCGALVDRLITVTDEDRSVGYCGELHVCEGCIDRRRAS